MSKSNYSSMRRAYVCNDGPWKQQTIYMASGRSLPLCIGSEKGYYELHGGGLKWFPLSST